MVQEATPFIETHQLRVVERVAYPPVTRGVLVEYGTERRLVPPQRPARPLGVAIHLRVTGGTNRNSETERTARLLSV